MHVPANEISIFSNTSIVTSIYLHVWKILHFSDLMDPFGLYVRTKTMLGIDELYNGQVRIGFCLMDISNKLKWNSFKLFSAVEMFLFSILILFK